MQQLAPVPNILKETSYDEKFLDDMLRVFSNTGRGEAGKYIYDGNNWNEIVNNSSAFYVPKADHELVHAAISEFDSWNIPSGTPYIDFGVGGPTPFRDYAYPVLNLLESPRYVGVDFCRKTLTAIRALQNEVNLSCSIETECMDFFVPSNLVISPTPALGVMNGITLTNIYGSLNDASPEANLIGALKYLSQLTNRGWLLLSIDTNQVRESLLKMYLTPLNSKLNIASLRRMEAELPVIGFDASLFEYTPEWFPEKQLLAHMATATEDQDFLLGDYSVQVREGQKLHMFNSYKFRQSFFEDCCRKASLGVVKSWKHQSGVMLYLLRDSRRVF